jgi:hypothetical protein
MFAALLNCPMTIAELPRYATTSKDTKPDDICFSPESRKSGDFDSQKRMGYLFYFGEEPNWVTTLGL